MKLKRLKIEKLHNLYNYDIEFFDNVNILFGKNGCGKTTILNIINYIISGKIYKLRQYEFKSIQLDFVNERNFNEKLYIDYQDELLVIKYNSKVVDKIEVEKMEEENFYEDYKEQEIYLKKYTILNYIKNIFNIVYLPLSRSSRDYYEEERFIRRIRLPRYNRENVSYLDTALEKAQFLVGETFARLNDEVNSLENKLKSEIFEIMFSSDNKNDIEESEFKEEDKNFIISNLKKFNISNSNLEDKITDFCKRYNKTYKKYLDIQKRYLELEEKGDSYNYESQIEALNSILKIRNDLISYNTVRNQVEGLRAMFEKYNEEINKIMLPIKQFENITNSFFKYSAIPKTVHVAYRKIYFEMDKQDKIIEISELSSGEKQIITFIAYFIFKVLPAEQPIFIVDEPEMSLHLMWQKNWITSIEELDNNIQLIVATHSPEIVSNYRNNMIKIEPQIEV